MRLKWTLLLSLSVIFVLLFSQTTIATSTDDRVETKFIHALMNQNKEGAQACVKGGVTVPKPKGPNRSISSYSFRTSGKEDSVILVGYYNGESGQLKGDLIYFIWELTISDDKITDIEVFY